MHPFNTKKWMLAATGLAVVMYCMPALAQSTNEKPATPQADDDTETVVIVKGLRKSLQSAVDRKRKSAQIVDSVDAEDAGKLPDNNVNEAIARISGVQIERERGEGTGLKIRGMEDVQTTLNGSPNNTGVGRAASLNDIPAELLKSVQIYKNRTADQAEGGIAGTVNVDLRRPFDLPKGWTAAGSVRSVYGSIGDTQSPYASALVANRFDTNIGEMGFLLNVSYQKNEYNEQWVTSESPAGFWGRESASLSAADQGAYAPYKVQNGVEHGTVERKSYNAAYQWRVNENFDVLIEASGFNADETRSADFLEARVKDGPNGVKLSNLVYQPDGVTLKSLTVTDTILTDTDVLAVGPYARDSVITTRNSRVNLEGHWHDGPWNVNFGVYKDDNRLDLDWYQQMLRIKNLASVDFDFTSSKGVEVAPALTFRDAKGNLIDFSDTSIYNVREIENGKGYESSKETVLWGDASVWFSDTRFLRRVQVGVRKTKRDVEKLYGYRYAGFSGTKSIALTAFPGGDSLTRLQPDVDGYQDVQWYRLSNEAYLANFDAIRALASSTATSSYGGGGAYDPLTGAVPWTEQWSTAGVPTERMMGTFSSTENTVATFAQAFYGFDIGNIPVDGVVGGRWVHTWGDSFSYNRVTNWIANPAYTPGSSLPERILGTPSEVVVPNPNALDYNDFLPSIHAVVHFTPKVQMRLAYSQNVQRPRFDQATSFTYLNSGSSSTGIGSGWGGNADLEANREQSFDASLEYYFGKGGVVSFAAYLKKPDGFIYDKMERETINGQVYEVWRPHNASEGIFQGYEFNAQGFFSFLPGKLSNFGGQFNYTYNQIAKINYNDGADNNAVGNSKFTYNAILYYDTPKLSARVAYNYRDRYRAWNYYIGEYSPYVEETSRLDAAINWTPIKQVTLSLEGTNLLENNTVLTWGKDSLLPQGVRAAARTVQISARFRY